MSIFSKIRKALGLCDQTERENVSFLNQADIAVTENIMSFEDVFVCPKMTDPSELPPFRNAPRCTMQEIAQFNPVFARVIKSSDAIAQVSAERHPAVETFPNSVCANPTPDVYPLCFSDKKHIITCMRYGDMVALLPINKSIVEKYGLQNEIIYKQNNVFYEYNANRFYVGEIQDFRDPRTIANIISWSDVNALKTALIDSAFGSRAIDRQLQAIGARDSVSFWISVVDAFRLNASQPKIAAQKISEEIESLFSDWNKSQEIEFSQNDDFRSEVLCKEDNKNEVDENEYQPPHHNMPGGIDER